MTRKVYMIIAGCAVMVVTAVLYWFLFLRVSYHGELSAQVMMPVHIYRLEKGYPLIAARNRNDALFALGFVHAQDRLQQMELLRIFADGKSAVYGLVQFESIDKLVAAVGLSYEAEAVSKELSPPYVQQLQQYVNGINTYKKMTARGGSNHEKWDVDDIVLITLFLEFCNAFSTNAELFFPVRDADYGAFSRTIANKNIVRSYQSKDAAAVQQIKKLQKIVASIFGPYGSYARGFAVAFPADAVYNGNPVLSASYEHSFSLYPLLYPVNMHIGNQHIEGYTYAGLPFISAGKTPAMRYASFSLFADSQIFSKHTTKIKNNVLHYESGSGYKALTCRNGSANCQTRFTDIGPVISDAFEKPLGNGVVSIAVVHPGKGYFEAMLDVPFAQSINEAVNIARRYKGQPRVFIVQDETRAVRIIMGNAIADGGPEVLLSPSKAVNQKNITALFEVRQSEMFAAGSEMIEKPSAAVQRVLTFNNTSRYSSLLNTLSQYPLLRHADIEKLLFQITLHDEKDVGGIISGLLADMPITSAKLAKIYFDDWNYEMNKDLVAPALYNAIIASLIKETFNDDLPYIVDDLIYYSAVFKPEFLRLFNEDQTPYFDDISTAGRAETRDMIFDRAFLRSLNFFSYTIGPYIDEWKWGRVHKGIVGSIGLPSFMIDLMDRKEAIAFSGVDDTVYRSITNLADYTTAGATVCVFYMDNTMHRLSTPLSITTNPMSCYYSDFAVTSRFTSIDVGKKNELMIIKPAEQVK